MEQRLIFLDGPKSPGYIKVSHISIHFSSIYQMSMLMLLDHQYMLQFLRSLPLV